LKHGPVVDEPLAWHNVVRERVVGTASVGRVEKARAAVVDVRATKRRFSGQKYDGQLVPGDRELQQGQCERYPKLPPAEIAQSRLHRIAGVFGGGRLPVVIVFLVATADIRMWFFRIVCHWNNNNNNNNLRYKTSQYLPKRVKLSNSRILLYIWYVF